MSDRVPRKSTVEKSRLLQEKLEARAKAKEFRSLESAAKAKKSTVEPENIDNSSEESSDATSNPEIEKESLEWDSDEESVSPSFLNNQENNFNRYTRDPTVDEIIKDISSLNTRTEHVSFNEEDEEEITVRRNRLNTSTDDNFLDPPKITKNLVWPPREPSEEPEDSRILESLVVLERVIEEETSSIISMDEATFKAKLRAAKVAEIAINDSINDFNESTVSESDLESYGLRLTDIRKKKVNCESIINEVLVDLNENEVEREKQLTDLKKKVSTKVRENENKVNNKMKEFMEASPKAIAEKENIEVQRQKLKDEKEKEQKNKEKNDAILKIELERIVTRIGKLSVELAAVKESKNLDDNKVRAYCSQLSKWETSLKEIEQSKFKADKDLVDATIDKTKVEQLTSEYDKLNNLFDKVKADLIDADENRSLFSLVKTVKEVALYPAPYGGKPNENLYTFKQRMLDALASNQIPERDKIEVLRKHLKGAPRDSISDDTAIKSIDEAFKILLEAFGNPEETWVSILNEFKRKCTNVKGWSSLGSYERRQLIFKTVEFLRKALHYAEEFPQLSNEIFHSSTINAVVEVLPDSLFQDIRKSDEYVDNLQTNSESRRKRCITKIKEIMEAELKRAVKDCEVYGAIKVSQANFNSLHNTQVLSTKKDEEKDRKLKDQRKSLTIDNHDCSKSRACNDKWGGLGCLKLYKLATVEERREHLKGLKKCFSCGMKFHGVPWKTGGRNSPCKWERNMEPARCQADSCDKGAATCLIHANESNATHELKAWLDRNNVASTLNTIISYAHNSIDPNDPPIATSVSKKVRRKLQSGEMSKNFSNSELVEFFKNDLNNEGEDGAIVHPIPEGDVSFIFGKICGKKNDVQVFFDNGCNCAIVRDSIPENEFRAALLDKGPIDIDVATGIKVQASGEWGMMLPLEDGSYQAVRCLAVPQVTAKMPTMYLKPLLHDIKKEHKGHPDIAKLNNLQVPQALGGNIDAIIGIRYANTYPELLFSLPNGLQIFKSRFKVAKKSESLCVGGPLGSVDNIISNVGAQATVRYLVSLISSYSSRAPRMEFFPPKEAENMFELYGDKDIPGTNDINCAHHPELQGKENIKNESEMELIDFECNHCGAVEQTFTVQSELKKFLQQQEAGLDVSFRCSRCRDCSDCKKGAGQEMMSMRQQAEQELIRNSVKIDKKSNRVVAHLPFLCDPTDKLVDNSRIAAKRLENVVCKYSSDEKIKEMLNKSMQKLFDNGHLVYLKDLPIERQMEIRNAKSSYTIPADVAFKESSISTPARWVFDAGSKCSTGYSLNDLLAKGTIDLVMLINMVMSWRMGSSAFCGDIRMFYNSILLNEDHWKYQQILIKPDLNPDAKTLIAVIKTLIYGVRPVGNQCEEAIKLLAEEVKEKHPEVALMLLLQRYVDDLGNSTESNEASRKLINDTTKILELIGMKIKGWAVSGQDPPEEISDDGSSVSFAGMTWYPRADVYKLNIDSLHFGKKRRGRYPSELVKFQDTVGMSIDTFTPEQITRTNCTSVVARIYDIQGLLAPVTLKLKNDLRMLIKVEPRWKEPIPDSHRSIWIQNFKTIENLRDILYMRCSIPSDAIRPTVRLLYFSDAANFGVMMSAYVCYPKPKNTWSCDLLFGKGLLAPEISLPQLELQGLSNSSSIKVILDNILGSWVEESATFCDSEISLSWTCYERVKLTTFVRNRVSTIRTNISLEFLYHVDGNLNPADIGTRPDRISVESVKPGSVWLKGHPWMCKSIDQARKDGVIKNIEDIKLNNEKKKIIKDGIIFDTFDTSNDDSGVFAVVNLSKIDTRKVIEYEVASNYLYPPLKRKFTSVVRITALVMLACAKFKKKLYLKQIERKERNTEDLKLLDFKQPKFSLFHILAQIDQQETGRQSNIVD